MNRTLLKKRILETPHMEPTDAVKLLYQNEFGCGHLIADEAAAIARVDAERAAVKPVPSLPSFAEIGNGLCRLNLHAKSTYRLPAQTIVRMMAETAAGHRGSLKSFVKKLETLRTLCAEGVLPFDENSLRCYLDGYAAENYPAVSHSAVYKHAYAPAYRVVRSAYAWALPVLDAIEESLASNGRALVVLDGDCAAGKTTLAALLSPLYHAAVLSMDDFFLPPALKTESRRMHPAWNIHHERFCDEVLPFLFRGSPFAYHRYDCQTCASLVREVLPSSVVIIEGSYSQHPAFAEAYSRLGALCVALWVSEEEQLRRLRVRNAALAERFVTEWIPLEKSYLQAYDIRQKADVTLCTDAWTHKEDFHEIAGD